MSKNTQSISATGQAIPAGAGTVNKVIVSASSSGVIKLIDAPNSPTGRIMLDNISVSAGNILLLDLDYSEGVHFVLVSGTATVQLAYEPSIN